MPHRSSTLPSLLRARSPSILAAVVVAALLLPSLSSAKTRGWHFVKAAEGVRVYDMPQPGRSLPKFRGVATIDAPAMQLLAILADVERSCEWNTACKHSILLKRWDDFRVLFHNRLKAPWPISDRDAILKTDAKISKDGKHIDAVFRAVPYPSRRPASGVVRFPRLVGKYALTALGPNRTRVVYTIDSDSGGWLPAWMVRHATQKVPIGTLVGLRKQAKRTRGQYTDFMAKHAAKVTPSVAAPTAAGATRPSVSK